MFLSTINTGHLFNEENIPFICNNIDVIKISMYGMSKKVYESVHRGSLVYEKVKENIDEFLSVAAKSKIYVIMTYLVLPENECDLDKWKDYYIPKCDRVDIWKPHNWGGHTMSNCEADSQYKPCNRVMGCNDIQICADGSVILCCFDYNRDTAIGNINESSLEEILNGDRLRFIQSAHKEKRLFETELACKYCDQIRDRGDALVFSTDKSFKVGMNSLIDYEEKKKQKDL